MNSTSMTISAKGDTKLGEYFLDIDDDFREPDDG